MHIRHIAATALAVGGLAALTATSALAAPTGPAGILHSALGTSHASATQSDPSADDIYSSCSGTPGTSGRECWLKVQTYDGYPPDWYASGGFPFEVLSVGSKILVTCWYYGNPGGVGAEPNDGIEDHVVQESPINWGSGHVPDGYVNEGGLYPYDAPYDIAGC